MSCASSARRYRTFPVADEQQLLLPFPAPAYWITPAGKSHLCDFTTAWNSITGNQLLIAFEDDTGNFLGWYRPEECRLKWKGRR